VRKVLLLDESSEINKGFYRVFGHGSFRDITLSMRRPCGA